MTTREKVETALVTTGTASGMFIVVLLVTLALLLVGGRPAQAQEPMPRRTKVALGCFIVGSYYDAINTAYWSAKGVVHEANPVYRPIVARHGIVFTMTIKGGGNTAIAAGVIKDSRKHPVRAFWSATGLCVGQAVVNILNKGTIDDATP